MSLLWWCGSCVVVVVGFWVGWSGVGWILGWMFGWIVDPWSVVGFVDAFGWCGRVFCGDGVGVGALVSAASAAVAGHVC